MTRTSIKYRYFIPLLAVAALLISASLLSSRDIPRTSAWKSWRVLGYPKNTPESALVDSLERVGIENFASFSNSRILAKKDEILPLGLLESENSRRSAWFSHGETAYLYIKDRVDLERKLEEALNGKVSDWFLEGEGGFLPILALLPIPAWIILFLFSKNRKLSLTALLPAILLPFSLNRWPGLGASVLMLLGTFIAAEYVPSTPLKEPLREQLARVFRSPYLAAVILLSIPLFFFVIPSSAIRILLAFALFGILNCLIPAIHEFIEAKIGSARVHPRFQPLRMAAYREKPRLPLIIKAFTLSILVFGAGFAGQAVMPRKTGNPSGVLSYPIPARYNAPGGFNAEAYDSFMSVRDDKGLPDLGDFLVLRWSIDTFPWRRLQNPWIKPVKGEAVYYTEYRIASDGKITGFPKAMETFDSAYIRRVLLEESTPLERMLMDQGRFVSAKMTRLSQ